MPRPSRRNLGSTGLPVRKREGNVMTAYDSLPPQLRRWMQGAALPWSPRSCRTIWQQVKQSGGTDAQAVARLHAVEFAMLKRERNALDGDDPSPQVLDRPNRP